MRRRAGNSRGRRSEVEKALLTREDIGYGPARQYELGPAGQGEIPRERRGRQRTREISIPAEGLGPYRHRLRRRERPDRWIQAEIEEALFLDTWIDADRIMVTVEDGVATLLGTLPSRKEMGDALRRARRVPGVRRVRNHLEVEARSR